MAKSTRTPDESVLSISEDSALVFPTKRPTHFIVRPGTATRVVQLLLLARTREERHAVAFSCFHRLTMEETAQRMKIGRERAEELLACVEARLAMAERHMGVRHG